MFPVGGIRGCVLGPGEGAEEVAHALNQSASVVIFQKPSMADENAGLL